MKNLWQGWLRWRWKMCSLCHGYWDYLCAVSYTHLLQNFGFSSIKDLPQIDDIESIVSGDYGDDAEAADDRIDDGQIMIEI